MAGNLKLYFCLIAIFSCIFSQTTASLSIDNIEEMITTRNGTITCTLVENHELLVQESIKRKSFLYKLHIFGPVVRFSDIPDSSYCPGDIVVIELFATDKIIIDKDYDALGEDITFVVAAPYWEISGKRLINLRGRDANAHERHTANNGRRDGNLEGENGKAGNPGFPGGHFHGIVLRTENFENLEIRLQGGDGGRGQNGGNGVDGVTGTTFDLSKEKIKRNGDIDGFDTILRREINPPLYQPELGKGIQVVVLGKKGTNGGNGGNGGIGGQGGLPGIYGFLNLENSDCKKNVIFKEVHSGRNGHDGQGGKGGLAGYSATDIILDLYFGNEDEVIIKYTENHEQEELLNGHNGLNGKSSENERKQPEHPQWQSFLHSLARYHDFLKVNGNVFLDKETAKNVVPKVNRVVNNVTCMLSLIQ
ncbi:uncharacterized protein LOC127277565 [Leptopilina boulardi]|uniref:uncharacterized protein LOC127277565 n=1 Tax=Leptopilina boulardi TaxID=63433 RepID=UPI0021F6097D|nr:uncharacterized protein LOC127277565 [Leptopilina boulardi]